MKILSSEQIRAWDQFTITNEPISSLDLMERASNSFVDWFVLQFPDQSKKIFVFCGNGNNGGDGLAISRLLHQRGYQVEAFTFSISTKRSTDNQSNLHAAQQLPELKITTLAENDALFEIDESGIIIDALFGSGLTREITGYFRNLIEHLNQQKAIRVAVDLPSGLFTDTHSQGAIFRADYSLSFQQPKLAFLFPENHKYAGEWNCKPIGLSPSFYLNAESDHHLLTKELAQTLLKTRKKFAHKGNFGHACLIVGSLGKMGAAILAAKACLRAGCGLLTVRVPTCGYDIMQISVPEAMVELDANETHLGQLISVTKYEATGIGCGLGTASDTKTAVANLLEHADKPLVLDADALNIISQDELHGKIPEGSILTPHPKEFERLFGPSNNDFERNKTQRRWARDLQSYIVLKGAHTCIATPEGKCYFNTTGNPGMATAGSGDVLTGIITGLLAQDYDSFSAALLGVYLHGLAGDFACENLCEQSMIAGDIINGLSNAIKSMQT